MYECLELMKNCYSMINDSINLKPLIGLDYGLFDFTIAVLLLYAICKVIMSGLFGKVVDYVNSPTEQEKFIEDVDNARYRRLVNKTSRRREMKVLSDKEV